MQGKNTMNAISPALPAFLSNSEKQHFIDGEWRPAVAGERLDTYNPATGKVMATLARGRLADVDAAVASARAAFEGPWSKFTPPQRQALLLKIADAVEKNFEELALIESMDMGSPITRLKNARAGVINTINYFAAQALQCRGETIPSPYPGNFTTMILKAPVGVVGGIIPWNGPMFSIWWVIGGALASGCTAVIKPAEDASLTALRLAELLHEVGVPKGVFNVVTGLGAEAGQALAAHPNVDRVAFTGSTVTGREIIKASAVNMKRIQLELGGKSPDIVFADANLDKAVPGAAMGVYNNSGQVCFAGTRVFVQRSIQDEFIERLSAFSKGLKVGDPLDTTTNLGPLISQRQLDRVMGYMTKGGDEGAKLITGGGRLGGELAGGFYVEPTVFSDVSNDMTIAREEIFGPVISVIPFDDADQALRLANDTDYGLGGAVWTRDLGNAMKMVHGVKSGQLWVNCYGLMDPTVGFGGYKHSGYGWKGGSHHVDGFLYEKAVTINAD
jgi:aldehyde dehydrogenase (NAD+)